MNRNKFSVGDKVRVISANNHDKSLGIKIGDTHTINSLSSSGIYVNEYEIHNSYWTGYLDYEQITLVN